KLHVVHCGLDAGLFEPPDRSTRSSPVEVLTVGRIVPVKGQSLLVRALADLTARGLDARLTVAGDGPGRGELERLAHDLGIADRVALPGAVGQDAICDHYARADVFALPSFAEGLPVVAVEAMAMELPVVASRITGMPELLDEGHSGLMVTPGRADALTDALARLIDAGPKRRAEIGRAGRAKVVAEFDLEHSAAQLLQIFAEAGAGSQGPTGSSTQGRVPRTRQSASA
ncbi:MAG: glycosyltransferase, partial [Actinobacteria bacterium]|nr:glycosyltransferase [Actinomycetota bacterium]